MKPYEKKSSKQYDKEPTISLKQLKEDKTITHEQILSDDDNEAADYY